MIRNIIIVLLMIVCGILGWELYKSRVSLPIPIGRKGEDSVSSSRLPQTVGRKKAGKNITRRTARRSVPRIYKEIDKVSTGFGSRVLEKGMRGPDVSSLRKRLILAGFIHLRNSREKELFDEDLEEALVEYQKGTKYLRQMYAYQGTGETPKKKADKTLCQQLLEIPPEDMVLLEYKVQRGDTLWKIANKHGLGQDLLAALNNITNPSNIRVGQKIIVICHRRDIKRY